MRIAVVGCGNIAPRYARAMAEHATLALVGAFDVLPDRARAFVEEFGGRQYGSLEEVLADGEVETVLNLTVHSAHAAVTGDALAAGKHVHTEKPLALDPEDARRLVALAREQRVRLSCAPTTFLGEAQQTALKLVRERRLGAVRLAYAEVNWGRIERWHPSPIPFYDVGPVVDVAVYPITLLAVMFGPVRRVNAWARLVDPDRVTLTGERFTPGTPDFSLALLEPADGPAIRLTATFYAETRGRQRGIELHGDDAALDLESWEDYDSPLFTRRRDGHYESVPLVRPGYPGKDWARALVDLEASIAEGRPHRASAELAAHVVDVLAAIAGSAAAGGQVEVSSTFEPPEPMEWA
jgi:predicted dehydrogenase